MVSNTIIITAILMVAHVRAVAAWIVNPSPTMVDSAISINVSEQRYASLMYWVGGTPHGSANGIPHVTFGFKAPLTSVPYDIWDVNMSNGVSRVTRATIGLPPVSAAALASNNVLVLGSAEPGYLWSYNPETGATNCLKGCVEGDRTYACAVTGPDGHVYLGTYYGGYVEQYDPATELVKIWGQMDTTINPGAGDRLYVNTIGTDSNFIYGALRENFASFNWYLGVLRKSDTNKTLVWKTGTSSSIAIFTGNAGEIYMSQITNSITKWFQLTNEVPVLLGSPPSYNPFPGKVNWQPTSWHTSSGWMYNIEATFDVSSASGSASIASVRYKPTTNSVYTTTSQTNGWSLSPGTVDILQPWTGNNLLWVVNAYGPLGTFTHQGATAITGPYKNLSAYDFLKVSDTEAYIAGYYQSTLRWNPSTAWTRVPLQDSWTATNVNPYTINPAGWGGIYHHYLARGNNGKIFVGSHHERGSSGGELGWYNPTDGTIGSNRTDFVDYDINDLKSAESGARLVYASVNTNIIVYDVVSFAKLTNFTVLNGATVERVAEYSSGNVIGVSGSNTVGFTTAGVQLWSNNLPVAPWGTLGERKRLTLGPDSYVWICVGGILYRVNPADGSKASILTTTNNYNVMFSGSDAFLYGTTSVWKMANLVYQDNEIRATTLNVGTINKVP